MIICKRALEYKGLIVNAIKTKAKAMKIGADLPMEIGNDALEPCGLCRNRVMRNSIHCQKCKYWIHKRCSNIKGKLMSETNYRCGKCKD